jgi:hypothetical protein
MKMTIGKSGWMTGWTTGWMTGWRALATVMVVLGLASSGCSSGTMVTNTGSGGRTSATGTGGAQVGSGGSVGNGSGGAMGTGGAIGQLALPVVVTTFYNNQGWFGDATVAAFFTPGSTLIRQSNSLAGPCAARQVPLVGNCLEVVYSPPTGLSPPDAGGAFVGVFFLTSLTMAHPELTPPANIGDPNWGDEPGKNIAPGATRISFRATSATDGLMVTFKAGTANDTFQFPEQVETLTTSWTTRSLSIAGISYGTSVAGAFAWILKDTTRPATFYLDGIVWE